MHKAQGVLIAEQKVQPSASALRLRLLVELEPRHRVFWGNLADLLLGRRVPPAFISARPAPFWKDVFVASGTAWSSFAESILGHILLIIVLVWSQSKVWEPVKLFPSRESLRRAITYSPQKPSFRAAEGRVSNPQVVEREKHAAHQVQAHDLAMPVKPEQKAGMVAPPDIQQAIAGPPHLPDSHPLTPMEPFSAATGGRRNALADTGGAVAPPPQVDRTAIRQAELPQTSVVAPAPAFEGTSIGRIKAANVRVVPPPPSIQSAESPGTAGRLSDLAGAGPGIVPPPPSVQIARNASGDARPGPVSGEPSLAVPPPPSVMGAGGLARTGPRGWASPSTTQVVPPPASIQDSVGLGGRAGALRGTPNAVGLSSTTGSGTRIVPPPPSVADTGVSSAGGRLDSFASGGSQVVPPSPSVEGIGRVSAGERFGSLAGNGSHVVPPAPSVPGIGTVGTGGHLASLSGNGSQVIAPPPSVPNASGAGPSGRWGVAGGSDHPVVQPASDVASTPDKSGMMRAGTGTATESQPGADSPAPANSYSATATNTDIKAPTVEELPLGSLGLVFAPPGSSFFSNFEVFVAKRRMGKDQLQLIKLVYEFLPYQRRLSEYGLDSLPPRVIKLRVTPDPSCNESLGSMIEPHNDPTLPARKYPDLPPELRAADINAVLPCYRTSAEDFRKAMSRTR